MVVYKAFIKYKVNILIKCEIILKQLKISKIRREIYVWFFMVK